MIAANAELREQLAACADLGIPHSQFLGGPGVWTDLDRAKLLGFRRYERSLCQNCRTDPKQWAADPDAFTYQLEHCEGCKRIADGQDAIPEGQKGYFVSLIPPRFARVDEN